jgi:DNA replication protein DnaC
MDAMKSLIPEMTEEDIETVTKNCGLHGDYESKVFNFKGKKLGGLGCPLCLEEEALEQAKRESHNKWQDRVGKINRDLNNPTLPPRFKDKQLTDYIANNNGSEKALSTCNKYADNFAGRLESGGGLIMCGQAGTGKTHLASGIINKIKSQRFTTAFMSVLGATRHVKSTYSKDNPLTESEAINHFIGPDLLILDEVGVQFGSEAEKIILFEIINQRYQHVKPTILISNLTLSELSAYIGERVVDRMYEGGGAILSFDWESHRRSNR